MKPLDIFNWYVVYTWPQFEKKVYSSLITRNIPCFLPLEKIVRERSDRKKVVEVPLFPNYVFVYATARERFRILNIRGVSRFIMYNGKPATIPVNVLDSLKRITAFPGIRLEDYKIGDTVYVEHEPFIGLKGVIYKSVGKTRFAVKIDAINLSISVELDTSLLKMKNIHNFL